MIYRQGFDIHWDYRCKTRVASISLLLLGHTVVCLDWKFARKEWEAEELSKGYFGIEMRCRWGRTTLSAEWVSFWQVLRRQQGDGCLCCCFCSQTSTSHYQLAGQSANSSNRLLGWMDGWMENLETRWRVAERSRVYKLILAKVSKKWWASVWVKVIIRNFPQRQI